MQMIALWVIKLTNSANRYFGHIANYSNLFKGAECLLNNI